LSQLHAIVPAACRASGWAQTACSANQDGEEDQLQHCDHRDNVDVVQAACPIDEDILVRPYAWVKPDRCAARRNGTRHHL